MSPATFRIGDFFFLYPAGITCVPLVQPISAWRLLQVFVTSQDAFAKRSLVDLPTVRLRLIFEFIDRLVGGNTVPQLYIL